MGRQSRHKSRQLTAWLPGFEPEGVEGAHLNSLNALISHAEAAPPSPPRDVSVVSALVAYEVMTQATNEPLAADARHALDVISSLDVDDQAASAELTSTEPLDDPQPAQPQKAWPQFDPCVFAPVTGTNARIETNIKAIRLMKDLAANGQEPTDAQRHELLSYIGWGGLAQVFEPVESSSLAGYHAQLKSLLSDEEFASARASTTCAFYTDPVVVRSMWDIVKKLGFDGGRIIEPCAGTGMFLACMPEDIARRSEVTAIELDKVSGQILQTAFGGLGVQTQTAAIEKAQVPHGFYDLAISNVPFGDHRTLETRKVGYANWLIHNYFFGKAVDLVRPGGLIVFVTSTGTMDSETSTHRKWLNAHAEMLGAIRLPRNAFKKQAGTDVVTDIIVLKKRAAPVFSEAADWLNRAEAPHSMLAPNQDLQCYSNHARQYVEYPRPINAWYAARPGMVIGELRLESTQYGQRKLIPHFTGDSEAFSVALKACAAAMPTGIYEAQKQPGDTRPETKSLVLQRFAATEAIRPGSFVVHDGRVCISEGPTWVDVDAAYKGATRERLLGLIKIRDAARRLLAQQTLSEDEAEFKSLQYALNVAYDAFVAKYDSVSDRANTRVFRTDPECPLVLSLELYDEDNDRYSKAAIFSKRTAGRKDPPATADNARDAMLISLALHGCINIADMAKRLGMRRGEVEKAMGDEALAYVDPQDGLWKPADEYLSGHIRNKIAAARAAGSKFAANVKALESVLPKDLGPAEVEVRLGAPWVPIDVIERFACELIQEKHGELTVSYDPQSATWALKSSSYRTEYAGNRMLNTATWGTAKRCALELIEAALNQTPPKITRKTPDDRTVVDRTATLAAREKYEAIKAEFKKWAYKDDARRDRLLRIYNDEFNQIVERRYDGSHLVLYGMSNVITPYKHQLDAVWRIVSGGNTLLAHVVGAGKTFTMVASAMELRRIGKAAKPCAVVPNHMLEQFTGDCVRFYPGAKVLMASKEDFAGDKRREFCARIATGDWDLVVMTHATFERVPMRPETTNRFVQSLMDQARLALASAEDGKAKRTIKQLEKLLKALEAKLERALNERAKDDFVYFDDLGIDHILVDEAHLFKNLMRISKMPAIAGLPNVASNRAFDLWAKTATIMERRREAEQGVTFATATPVANSLAELHTMMKFLQPRTLRAIGLYEFDAWAATFGEAVQGMEVAPDGSGYRLNTRFSRFVNVPDLMAIFKLVADIRTRSMLNLPTPNIRAGKPQTLKSPAGPELKAYTAELVERANKIRSGLVQPHEDNMLAVSNCGRKAALDMRLVDPSLPFDPQGKVAQARDQIVRIWKETASFKGTQMVFCDLSTPSSSGFSVYNDLKARLIGEGIPAEEIAFIHDYESDAAKAKLFRQVRAGQVRVLMGSTQKMGMGTNVQKKLKAVHQLDAPWRPADVEQRDGRAWRAGNDCDEIELLRYVTQGSFDAYVWSLLETKARFIDQIMSSAAGLRTVEDLSMGALTFAEIKAIASGNPLVLEKATVDAEVMKISLLKDQWDQDRWRWSRTREHNKSVIEAIQSGIAGVEMDAEAISQERDCGWKFKPKGPLCEAAVGVDSVSEQIGAQTLQVNRSMPQGFCGEVTVGTVAGMRVILRRYDGVDVLLESINGSGCYRVDRTGVPITSVGATGHLVLERLQSLIEEPSRQTKLVQRLEQENRDIDQRLVQDFDQQDKLDALLARQRQIDSELDLDKDQEGAEAAEADSEAAAA